MNIKKVYNNTTKGNLRDRPFNLRGGYGFLFRSEFFFRTTQVRILIFFVLRSTIFFLQNLTLSYMSKTLNLIIIFFLHQNQNIFFSNIGNQNIFLEKKPYPSPFKLNGRSPRPKKNRCFSDCIVCNIRVSRSRFFCFFVFF